MAATGACLTDMSQFNAGKSCAEYEADSDIIKAIKSSCDKNPYGQWLASCPSKKFGCLIIQPNIMTKTWFLGVDDRSTAESSCKMLNGKFLAE